MNLEIKIITNKTNAIFCKKCNGTGSDVVSIFVCAECVGLGCKIRKLL